MLQEGLDASGEVNGEDAVETGETMFSLVELRIEHAAGSNRLKFDWKRPNETFNLREKSN